MEPGVEIRLLDERDSLEDLTAFLHRAYATLAARGLRFMATWQDVDATRRRIEGGEALVAVADRAVVGTVTWYAPDPDDHGYYARPGVATFGQFGVEPALRGRGIGRALVVECEARARAAGATELACDTAAPATDLVAMYERWGYRVVAKADYRPHTNYESVVLSKTL